MIRNLLDAKSIEIRSGDAVAMQFWLRTEIPASADADQVKNGLTWREIPETTLLGVVSFTTQFTDYRKQEIPAGVYSLRLAQQPDIGDHKDTAPHADFALLVPIAKETSPDTMDAKDLLKLSRAATGGDHPAVMLLYPVKDAKKAPAIRDRGDGVRSLDVLRSAVAENKLVPMGLSITIAGGSKAR